MRLTSHLGRVIPSSCGHNERTYRYRRRAKAPRSTSSPLGSGDIWDRHGRPESIPAFDRRTNGLAPAGPFVHCPLHGRAAGQRSSRGFHPHRGSSRGSSCARRPGGSTECPSPSGRQSSSGVQAPRRGDTNQTTRGFITPGGRGAASLATLRGQRRRAATGTRVRTITRSGSSTLVPRNDATASSSTRGVRSRRGAGAVGRSTTAPRASSASAMDERGRIRIGRMGDGPTWQAGSSACLPYRGARICAYGRSVSLT